MITTETMSLRQILRETWRPLSCYLLWNMAVIAVWRVSDFRPPDLPIALFGSALILFLGLKVNAAYARWWEARTLWGAIINASRSLAREVATADRTLARTLGESIIVTQIGYVHALRCQLRRLSPEPELTRILPDAEAQSAARMSNVANGLLTTIAARVEEASRAGDVPPGNQVSILFLLRDLSNAQGGLERIRATPLPVHYRLAPRLFTLLFCLVLPFGLLGSLGMATPIGSMIAGFMFFSVLEIGRDLADPFANGPHDVSMDAITRTIEIDLRELLDQQAPPPLTPVDGVLS